MSEQSTYIHRLKFAMNRHFYLTPPARYAGVGVCLSDWVDIPFDVYLETPNVDTSGRDVSTNLEKHHE